MTVHCPHRTQSNTCGIADRLTKLPCRTNDAACNACLKTPRPRGLNVVTLGMAIANRRRRKQPVTELLEALEQCRDEVVPEQTVFKLNEYRPGPGSELKRMLSWFAQPEEGCNCETHAETMNQWGADDCRRHLDEIVGWLIEEAEARGLPHGRFTQKIARNLVVTAISRFERKFPDGPPEPADDEYGDEDR